MKKISLLLISFLGITSVQGQNVGIGTATPDASALLELNATNRGFLITRMTQAQRTAIAAPATGLLVYQTDGAAGFWYFNGTTWVNLTNNWMLTGNAGTNPTTNFIGTTDNVGFSVRTNNTERIRVTNTGSVGIGTATPSARFHVFDGDIELSNINDGFIMHARSFAGYDAFIIAPKIGGAYDWTRNITFERTTGNVGIGTGISPSQRLHVSGGSILTDRAYAASTVNIPASLAAFNTGTNPATQVRITDNGSGAANGPLTYGATPIEGQYLWITNSDAQSVNFSSAGTIIPSNTAMGFVYTGGAWRGVSTANSTTAWNLTGNAGTSAATNFIGTTDNVDFVTRTNSIERMRVTAGGNVGIGTAAPAVRVQVASGDLWVNRIIRATAPSDGTNAGIFETYNETNGRFWHITQRSGDSDKLIFWRNNGTWADVLTLTMDQRVGIATTNPQVRLAVNGPGANIYATDAWIENNLHVQGNENVSGGRGRLRVGTAWDRVGLYAEPNSVGTANDLILGASSGWTRIGPGGGGQHLRWGNSTLVDDQGGSIELGGSNWVGAGGTGTPYIDWHINDGYTRDYDMRLIGTTDAYGPVLRLFSHAGATHYFYFDLDWIGAYDCWADVSAWRYFANANNNTYADVYNDLELIENIRPQRIEDPKSKEQVIINNPTTMPNFLVKPTHNNPNSYAVDITKMSSFSLGAIRMLRRETKSEYDALNAKIQRLENIVEQLTGQKLGELEFSAKLTLYKDMDKMVIMDVRITPESKITVEGISDYRIVDQKEGTFTIQLSQPLSIDTPITYKSSYK
ncbi:MAG: hypothetical protein NZ108_03685 [Bacteroidia bacterium]|nr:hypothetical protein [Bacteroidia bacterium]